MSETGWMDALKWVLLDCRPVDPDIGRLLGLSQTSQRCLGRAGQILGLRVLIFLLIPSLLIQPEALDVPVPCL